MKNLSKLFLVILMLSSAQAQANTPWPYPAFHCLLTLGHHASSFAGSVRSTINFIQYKNQIPTLPDVPEVVMQFCHEKLKAHGLNPDVIQIKVKADCELLEAFENNCIVFSPAAANQFTNTLENQTDEESIRVVKIYSTFLDHEIAHLKNNDLRKRHAVLFCTSLISYAASTYLIYGSRFSSYFQKPTNIKEFFGMLGSYGLVAMGRAHFTKYIYSQYAQYQESNADAYAITHATDAAALRHTADCLEKLDNGIIEFLCGAQASPNIGSVQLFSMELIRSMLITQYQLEKPEEEFRSWVKKQTHALASLKSIYDPEHPSGFSRAQNMRAAADALEAQATPAEAHIPLAA